MCLFCTLTYGKEPSTNTTVITFFSSSSPLSTFRSTSPLLFSQPSTHTFTSIKQLLDHPYLPSTTMTSAISSTYRNVIASPTRPIDSYSGVTWSRSGNEFRPTRWGPPLDQQTDWLPIEYVTTLISIDSAKSPTRYPKSRGTRFTGREVTIHSIGGKKIDDMCFKSMNECLRHFIAPTYNPHYKRNTTKDFQKWTEDNNVVFTRATKF